MCIYVCIYYVMYDCGWVWGYVSGSRYNEAVLLHEPNPRFLKPVIMFPHAMIYYQDIVGVSASFFPDCEKTKSHRKQGAGKLRGQK